MNPSPKRPPRTDLEFGAVNSYAGYSEEYVGQALRDLTPDDLLLDPWNGAGTTTGVARRLGVRAVGFDINPASVLAARARQMDASIRGSLPSLSVDICRRAHERLDSPPHPSSLLRRWLTDATVTRVLALRWSITSLLADPEDKTPLPALAATASSLAAYFYVVLFRTVRSLVTQFAGSNPTWIRRARSASELVDIDMPTLIARFVSAQRDLAQVIPTAWTTNRSDQVEIGHADSSDLPLADGEVSAVLTSPPYCTRIDYVMATLPELAALGMSEDNARTLRDSMIGTPTITRSDFKDNREQWGETARSFLALVEHHTSQASGGYYAKQYCQYFTALARSVREIGRVTRREASLTVVVQDSYYKECRLPLDRVIDEMVAQYGWEVRSRDSFVVRTPKAAIHPHIRRYRSVLAATETATTYARA